ncbi:MAG: thermonuclease family protein [Calditrichaeota bacterium]|nr:thermonuclease family protein [Calditrichota bacterium]
MRTRKHTQAIQIVTLVLVLAVLGCRHSSSTVLPFRVTPVEKKDIVVEDGDTFLWKGQRVRMLGIDCAETNSPYHKGNQDPWGTLAEDYLREQIKYAKQLSMIRIEQSDRYGRWLAYLLADGENVNAKIIQVGLAYETVTHYGKQGLDKYAEECLEAAKTAPKPEFENPAEFRKRNRKN